jgi:hypothetical protein
MMSHEQMGGERSFYVCPCEEVGGCNLGCVCGPL